MPQQLLPETFLNNTTHLYLPEVRARSMLLYGMVLLAVIGAAVAAFFVKIDVSFAAAGAVRSVAEKTEIRSLVSGAGATTQSQCLALLGKTVLTNIYPPPI
jgi:membrane fusion protein, peptide pheromone/bacteriocin exporter